jgi:radical SAM protein with 4Fe4S-binding SPASM domain
MYKLLSPIYVGIDLTNRCNLRCIHCRTDASPSNHIYLPFNIVRRLLEELREMKVIKVIFSGGEPFIRKDIFKIISYAVDLGIPELAVISNGTLLNKSKVYQLKKTGLKHIAISLDGLEYSHDLIRGKGSFKKTVKNIELLLKNKFKITLVITFNKLNYKDFEKLVNFAKNLGIHHIEVGNLMPFGRGENIEDKILTEIKRRHLFKEYKKFKKLFKHNFIDFESSFLCKPAISKKEEKIIPFMGCRGGRTSCAVLSNGNVVACKLLPNIVAGNILNKNFKKIWLEDRNWQEFREDRIPLKCRNVNFLKHVGAGVRH